MAVEVEVKGFAVGDTVEWTSQSMGYTRTKRGVIVKVIQANNYVYAKKDFANQNPRFDSGARNHESYIVSVKGRGVYWPRVAALKRAESA